MQSAIIIKNIEKIILKKLQPQIQFRAIFLCPNLTEANLFPLQTIFIHS